MLEGVFVVAGELLPVDGELVGWVVVWALSAATSFGRARSRSAAITRAVPSTNEAAVRP